MKKLEVIKFSPIEEQDEYGFGLDDSLIPYWHIIQEAGQGEFTACGQAVSEYKHKSKKGKVTCPDCLEVINFYKNLGKEDKKKLKKFGEQS